MTNYLNEGSDARLSEAASINQILADEERIKILLELRTNELKEITQLADLLDGEVKENKTELVHKHLPKLEDYGAVEINGQFVEYTADDELHSELERYQEFIGD